MRAKIERKPYVKPTVRKIDSQGTEGKRLLEQIQTAERRGGPQRSRQETENQSTSSPTTPETASAHN
jgi:hypothetical protein